MARFLFLSGELKIRVQQKLDINVFELFTTIKDMIFLNNE